MKEPYLASKAGIVPKGRKKASHFLEYYHTKEMASYASKQAWRGASNIEQRHSRVFTIRNMGPQLLNFSLGTIEASAPPSPTSQAEAGKNMALKALHITRAYYHHNRCCIIIFLMLSPLSSSSSQHSCVHLHKNRN